MVAARPSSPTSAHQVAAYRRRGELADVAHQVAAERWRGPALTDVEHQVAAERGNLS